MRVCVAFREYERLLGASDSLLRESECVDLPVQVGERECPVALRYRELDG